MTALRLVTPSRRPTPPALVYSDHREKDDMQSAIHPSYPRRGDHLRFYLAYGATYPLFLVAETLQRRLASASLEGTSPAAAQRSVFAAARESTLIAISYVLMARTTLRKFARQSRTKRLS